MKNNRSRRREKIFGPEATKKMRKFKVYFKSS
jgi:hypothetical protein